MAWKSLIVVACLAAGAASDAWAQSPAPHLDAARLYHDYCSVCHGDHGNGKSHAARDLKPPPRDFTTPQSATELTRTRMVASIREGRPGTAMAAWKTQLTDTQIGALTDYIRDRFMVPTAYDRSNEGRRVYAEYCSVCHGDRGNGRSRAAPSLDPKPRDFTAAAARRELTRERMIFSTSYGRPNTAMAGWKAQLTDRQIAAVVDYVRTTFMDLGGDAAPAAGHGTSSPGRLASATNRPNHAVDFSRPFPMGLKGRRDRGQAMYLANCVPCHGVQGNGKGPRAFFILPRPRDFTHPAVRASFNRPRLYRAIAKGVLGAEMPAWEKVLNPQEIADIAEYMLGAFIRPPRNDSAR